jgi:hypothetical protein
LGGGGGWLVEWVSDVDEFLETRFNANTPHQTLPLLWVEIDEVIGFCRDQVTATRSASFSGGVQDVEERFRHRVVAALKRSDGTAVFPA